MTLESQSQYPSVLSSIFVATEDRNLLSLLCSHLSQCHHRAEWPVVCSGVHYYNIRSYLEYTNRLTALHWSRRKKGTEAHMSGIFQNIEPPPPAKAPWLYLQAFSHSSWYYFALVTTNDNDGRANRRTDWTDYGSSFNLQFNFYLALCTALSPTASSLEAIEATGHSAVNHCACPIVINRYT